MKSHIITVFLGIFMLFMTVFGGYVSSRNKRDQIIFIFTGVICLILLVIQTMMTYENQNKIESNISSLLEASNKIKKIDEKQLEIRQKEKDAYYSIVVSLIPDLEAHRLILANAGKTNIYLWSSKLGKEDPVILREPQILAPGYGLYVDTAKLEKTIKEIYPLNGEEAVPFEVFSKNEKSEEYILKFILGIIVTDGKISIHTQHRGTIKEKWSEKYKQK